MEPTKVKNEEKEAYETQNEANWALIFNSANITKCLLPTRPLIRTWGRPTNFMSKNMN